ncbi:NCAIR mutase (PurE)-related protein [Methanohalophilus levihalophilus]|uniref:nickel pincer cofactor biosynthesis protein LarB n=1 Tax=Methanohalophilus levihalophilus TaxID=1431282 RepID=UPI001AE2DC99|nr:nickel pincer cofactor biosynthesis protein LarB [Methanohalophilus levihalophilus]MBP2029653.1 NCAIR mutase (PurE)-related protein [Methanohalophilus levihalophilus]
MKLEKILEQIKNGEIDLETAKASISSMGYTPVSEIAKIDTCRRHRTGIMEAILAEGKKPHDVVDIANVQITATGRVLITRIGKEHKDALEVSFAPEQIDWSLNGTTAVVHNNTPVTRTGGVVAIITAGTADIPVAEEARMVASEMGCDTLAIYDVGVAGLHRLVGEMHKLQERRPDSIIVAAGREGTLPTIVSGLVDVPVIGLPVSTGYGAGGKGKAAMFSMLQSCSVISVVNIDAGFVAGAFAARIANTVAEARKQSGDCE